MAFQTAEKKRAYYQANKEKYLGYVKKYRSLYPEKTKEYAKRQNKTIAQKFFNYKYGAIYRGLEFNLSKELFSTFENQPCSYCGKLCFGIDRVNSTIGYVDGNMVACCTMCNFMKRHHSKEDFINQCKLIAERN